MSMVMPGNFVATTIVIMLLLFPATSLAIDLINFTFNSFNQSEYDKVFHLLGDSSITTTALQITPDSLNDAYSLSNKAGRVMLLKPFKLWEVSSSSSSSFSSLDNSCKNSSMDSGTVASFNSTFLINIYRSSKKSVGEGFAFVIAPDLNIPSSSYGQWLGLTNATLDNNPSNKIVAIELDTVKQDFDPDDNHMGLDIYSVNSSRTISLSKYGIQIAPEVAKNYTVWVQYDGRAKVVEVYMADADSDKPSSPILSEKINLEDYVSQYSYMGFSASTGVQAQLNCVLKWDLSIEVLPEKRNLRWVKIVIGVGVLGLALLGIVVCGLVRYLKKRRVWNESDIEGTLKNLPGTPKELRYRDLKKATNNFDEKMKLGQGGFGVVYKGMLPWKNTEIAVAVKKFSTNGIDDFLAELTIINRLRHKHLVQLLGWCYEKGLLLLVYDYMPNGSLDKHLFGGPGETLNWERRSMIITDVASALHYLHNEYDQRVVHRDLKPSNVMLDSNFNARLGDFGLARALDNEQTSYSESQLEGFPGTLGYVAPECFQTLKATTESDVFGFGAVVLEVVCGQHPWINNAGLHSLVDWVWSLYREGRILDAVDERIEDDYDAEQAERLLLLGLACSHPIAAQRPKTRTILEVILGYVAPPAVPLIKPNFVWPAMGFNVESLISDTQEQDPTSISSSCYVSVTSELTPSCESRESFVSYSGISLG